MGYKEAGTQSSRTVDWEKEKEIEGVLLQVKEDVGENHSRLYIIEVEGEKVSVWGTTVIDAKMLEVKVGAKVKITFNGLKDSPKRKGKQYRDFIVMFDDEGVEGQTDAIDKTFGGPYNDDSPTPINDDEVPQ